MAYKKLFSFKQYLTMICIELNTWGSAEPPDYNMDYYWIDSNDPNNFDVKIDTPMEQLFLWACAFLTLRMYRPVVGINPQGFETKRASDYRVWEVELRYYRGVYKAFRSWHENQTAHGGHIQGESL